MKHKDSGSESFVEWLEITDSKQAELLSDPKKLIYLKPFLAKECTVKQAAEELNVSLDAVLYRVRALLKADLLYVVRQEKRGGRPIKHYRSTANGYFIPFYATTFVDLEEELRQSYAEQQNMVVANIAHILREAGIEGHRIYRVGEAMHIESSPALNQNLNLKDPALRSSMRLTREIILTREDAERLQHELEELVNKYGHDTQEGHQLYFVAATLVPILIRN